MSTKSSTAGTIGHIKSDVENAGQKAAFSPLMEALTRVGYGARGVIYFVMGLVAINVVLGKGGAPTDQKGAIATIGSQPAGLFLLWLVLLGLVSYSLWGVVRAVWDPLRKGRDLKGLVERAGYLFSAASYALLILPTYGYISGAGRSAQGGAQSQQSMASVMSTPLGRLAIGVIGLGILAAGLFQIYQGFKNSFDKQFQTYALNATELKIVKQLGRFGTATRGVILGLVGGLVILAAYQSNASQPIGIDAALATLLKQPYGVWLLGIVALGLMAFGIYSGLSAAWFRIKR